MIRRRTFRMLPLKNIIRLAVWLELPIADKSDQEVAEMVFLTINGFDIYPHKK